MKGVAKKYAFHFFPIREVDRWINSKAPGKGEIFMAENNSVRQEAALAETVPKEQRKTSQRNGVKKSKEKDQESGKKWTWQEVAEKRKQQMTEITERLETGLKEYMTTDETI